MNNQKRKILNSIIIIQFLLITDINSAYFSIRTNFNNINLPFSSQAINLNFNENNAYDYIVDQLNIGFRVPGTPEHDECADWIREELSDKTDEIISHNYSIEGIDCQNIIGKINPQLSDIVIFGAHWDSRAIAEKDTYNRTQPIPGANDGASGVAVLLELANVLYDIGDSLTAQVWFLFIDAEDQGNGGLPNWDWCEGANAFADVIDNYCIPDKIQCFILLDMVGGSNLKLIKESTANNRYPSLYEGVYQEGRNLGYGSSFSNYTMSITDDHISFMNINIPSIDMIIDFSNGPWTHHHKHSDDIENIDAESLKISGRTVESFVHTYYSSENGGGNNFGFPNWRNDRLYWEFLFRMVIVILGGILIFIITLGFIRKTRRIGVTNSRKFFKKGEEDNEIKIKLKKAWNYQNLGMLDDALLKFQEIQKLMDEKNNLKGKALVLTAIGGIFYEKKKYYEALDALEKCLEIPEEYRQSNKEILKSIDKINEEIKQS
ncbi:MAG: M28 family peptidase [archaeon]|nr:M28 family peptidase [archaeon]